MEYEIRQTDSWGKVLWLTNEQMEVGVALEFGIRIVHLSCLGMENLYYVQPDDCSDGFTNGDWKLRGGHRLWMAPESEESYCPDNTPIHYTLEENGVLLWQDPDARLHIGKRLRLTFLPDGGLELEHTIENLSENTVIGASWGVNTLDGGGVATIQFSASKGGYNPKRVVSLWSDTNLHDERVRFDRNSITATHLPMSEYFKIGVYSNPGQAVLHNKGQEMTITFDALPYTDYMDNGCNFELYLCSQFMELETLGPRTQMKPGEFATHKETWHLQK